MIVEGQVGPRYVGDGSNTELRQARLGGLVVTDGHGRYYEPASRGTIFSASTAVAGVAPGTALSTTPPFIIWNPPGSGVWGSIDESTIGYISGTIGAGTIVWAFVPSQATAPSGGTSLVPVGNNLSVVVPKLKVFQGSTLASTPQIIKPAWLLQPTLATAPAAGGFVPASPAGSEVSGLLQIPPGAALCLQGVAAAGSTPLVLLAVSWEEVPV